MRAHQSEFLKSALQQAVSWFLRLHRKREDIRSDLDAGDAFTRRIHGHFTRVNDQVRSPYHHDTARDLGELALWVQLADTAYQDQFRAFVRAIAEDSDWFLDNVPKRDPEDFFVNVTHAWNREGKGAKLK